MTVFCTGFARIGVGSVETQTSYEPSPRLKNERFREQRGVPHFGWSKAVPAFDFN
jgi:hypothetical protein